MNNFKFKKIACPICKVSENKSLGFNGGKSHPNGKGVECEIFQCNKCNLLYPNPFPFPKNIQLLYNKTEDYFTHYASKDWDKRSIEHEATIKKIFKYLKNKEKYDLLEIGSGRGEFQQSCKKFNKINPIGIDISDEYIKYAKKKGLTILNKDLDYFINLNQKFDIIILIAVIEHVHDPDLLIKKINSVTNENAIIYIDCPNEPHLLTIIYKYLMKILRKNRTLCLQPTWPPYHVFGFNKKSISKILNNNNFSILNFKIFAPPKVTIGNSIKKIFLSYIITTINIFGNMLHQSQNIFLIAKKNSSEKNDNLF